MSNDVVADKPVQTFVNPTQATADFIWRIVITAIAVVLVGSFLAIALSALLKVDSSFTQILLTIFTSVITFVGGLLIKSPVQQGN